MSRSKKIRVGSVLLATLATTLSLSALSQQANGVANGLGESFPQTQNLSAAPGWRVYRFERDGVKYLQINTAAGEVLAAVATTGGHFITLPIGERAASVSTPDQPRTAIDGPAVKIYDDGVTQITARTATDGTVQISANAMAVSQACGECFPMRAL